MKTKQKAKPSTHKGIINCTQKEKGITLVALIITIIILVILSAVSISAVYKSKIIDYAIDGAQKYASEGINENKVMEGTEKLIESAVNTIRDMGVTGGEIPNPNPDPNPNPNPPEDTEIGDIEPTEALGKYVDYKPQGSNYTLDKTYSGYVSDQTIIANNNMKWRIYGKSGNKLLLISEKVVGNISLKGAEGYNNGVKLLNDACSTAFGNSSYGSAIKVRSINQDDIDKVTNMTTDEQRKAVTPEYGRSYTPIEYYRPNIFEVALNRSKQTQWYTGSVNAAFSGRYTFYTYVIASKATQTMYSALLTNPTESSTAASSSHSAYWVASRCVEFNTSYGFFSLFRVDNGNVSYWWLLNSHGDPATPSNAVRPMVEVNLDFVTIGATGDGTATNPYSMAKK